VPMGGLGVAERPTKRHVGANVNAHRPAVSVNCGRGPAASHWWRVPLSGLSVHPRVRKFSSVAVLSSPSARPDSPTRNTLENISAPLTVTDNSRPWALTRTRASACSVSFVTCQRRNSSGGAWGVVRRKPDIPESVNPPCDSEVTAGRTGAINPRSAVAGDPATGALQAS